jgi:beta-glucosidase
VTNTGSRPGDQVIQLYIGFDNSAVEREYKLLKGFQRVSLNPAETRKVIISCPFDKLRYYDPAAETWQLEKMEYRIYMGSSSDEDDLMETSFIVE